MSATRRLACLSLAWALLASCDAATGPAVSDITAVEIGRVVTGLSVGDTVRLTATARGRDGAAMDGAAVHWSSTSPEIARVDQEGKVVAVAEGEVGIAATAGERSALVRFTVRSPAAAVVVTPSPVGLRVGEGRALSAAVTGRDGLPFTGRVSWSTTNPAVVAVDSVGAVRGVALGTATVVAAVGSTSDSVRVAVSGPTARVRLVPDSIPLKIGERWLLRALAEDAQGNEVLGVPVRWSTSDSTTIALDSLGSVRGVGFGRATVSATVEGVRGNGVVRVVSARVDSMAVWPDVSLVLVGSSRSLQAELLGTGGARVTGPVVTWSSSDPAIATVDDRGIVHGRGAGTVEIRAWSEGREAAALVHVEEFGSPLVFRSVYTGGAHGCGLTESGRAYCWGEDSSGQLGTAQPTERCGPRTAGYPGQRTGYACASLPRAVNTTLAFTSLTLGSQHTCGLTADGAAYCWGSNYSGALGTGTTASTSRAPARVSGGLSFRQISAGSYFVCGVTREDRVYCWGNNGFGQLGNGDVVNRPTPTPIASNLAFASVAAGGYHTCALTAAGEAHCWGRNADSELARGPGADVCRALACPLPAAMATDLRFVQVEDTCGLDSDGQAFCWAGALGGASTTGSCLTTPVCSHVPVPVPTPLRFVRLQKGNWQTCGLTADGAIHCWTNRPPVRLEGVPSLATLSYRGVACGIGKDGIAYCWGGNYSAQLGNGTLSEAKVATAVAGQR